MVVTKKVRKRKFFISRYSIDPLCRHSISELQSKYRTCSSMRLTTANVTEKVNEPAERFQSSLIPGRLFISLSIEFWTIEKQLII